MKRHLTGKRKANAAVEPKAETETPTRRVAPRVSYGQLESEVPVVDAPSPAEVPAVAAPSPAPAATPPALEEPVLAAAENQWKEEEEHGRVTSAGAAEASTLVEVDRLRQRLAAQERRNAEWQRINLDMLALTQRINLDMLALTQRVMAMAAEGGSPPWSPRPPRRSSPSPPHPPRPPPPRLPSSTSPCSRLLT